MTGWCVTENLVAATGRGFQDAKTTTLAILEWTRKVTAHEPHGRHELCGELHLRARPPAGFLSSRHHPSNASRQAVLDVGRVQGGQGELHLTGVLRGDIQHDPLSKKVLVVCFVVLFVVCFVCCGFGAFLSKKQEAKQAKQGSKKAIRAKQ